MAHDFDGHTATVSIMQTSIVSEGAQELLPGGVLLK